MLDSKYFLALTTVLAAFGRPYLDKEMGGFCESIMDNALIRKLILFSILYINTQDLQVSLLGTILLYMLTNCFAFGKPLCKQLCKHCGK